MIVVAVFLAGCLLLYLGAEWLVRGAAAVADALGIPKAVIGLTLVAFGTSAPELFVNLIVAARVLAFSCWVATLGALLMLARRVGATWQAFAAASVAFGATAWLPGSRLPRALSFVGEGRVPEPLDWRVLLGLTASVAIGGALALFGLRSWRHGR